jgi:hypothetical protein
MATRRVPVLEQFAWQPPVNTHVPQNEPPSSIKGDRFIVGGVPAGLFITAAEHDVAWYDGTAWHFDSPTEGWHVWSIAGLNRHIFTNGAWEEDVGASGMELVPTATDGNLASFDAAGQVQDAGVAATALSALHTQGTDQFLDEGGVNEVTAAQVKEAYDKRAQYDSDLGVIFFETL